MNVLLLTTRPINALMAGGDVGETPELYKTHKRMWAVSGDQEGVGVVRK